METRLAGGESLRSIARSFDVTPFQLREWKRNRVKISSTQTKKKSAGPGMTGMLKPFEAPLIGYALDQRALGVPVTYGTLVIKACQLCEEFRAKTETQQYHIVRRLAIINCLVDRAFTHKSQALREDMEDEAREWLTLVRPILQAPNVEKKFVINMDQTPVFMSMHPRRTLDLQGRRTISCRKSANSTARLTVTLAVSADGDKLKPMVIFKGKADGRIATRELPEFETSDELLLCCQEHAWQDERNMERWIDTILVPYLQEKAEGVPVFYSWTSLKCTKVQERGLSWRLLASNCSSSPEGVLVCFSLWISALGNLLKTA